MTYIKLKEDINVDTYVKKLRLSHRNLYDLECLLTGVFAPLDGFLCEDDYNRVCRESRLVNYNLWPMPITLDVSESFAQKLSLKEKIWLTDDENTPIASIEVSSVWKPDKNKEAELVFGTTDQHHPGVAYLLQESNDWYIGGRVTLINLKKHFNFCEYRHTPAALKEQIKLYGFSKVVAFQTRNPLHRAHFELTRRAAHELQAALLLHPVVGPTKPGDIDPIVRIKCYIAMLQKYNLRSGVMLSLLPLAMRMAGPREALWHALIRKNYGATHFIVGRDHAGPGLDSKGLPFYEPYAAQEMVAKFATEIGITPVLFPEFVYVEHKRVFCPVTELNADDVPLSLSGTQIRKALERGETLPDWFTFKEVAKTLKTAYVPRNKRGFTIFFTGLSGAGKSTLAKALAAKLQETTSRTFTILDGDEIRQSISSELGFGPRDREKHIGRVGFVAQEITKHKGIAIIAAIAPYCDNRDALRKKIEKYGGFIEIYVSTPLKTCKKRDIKGLYKKAESGLIKEFTGISAPYEEPTSPEIKIDTTDSTIDKSVDIILQKLEEQGWIADEKEL